MSREKILRHSCLDEKYECEHCEKIHCRVCAPAYYSDETGYICYMCVDKV